MNHQTIYVWHKSGANNHYSGLKSIVEENGGKVIFREFSILSMLFKSLIKLKFNVFSKQILNAFFLFNLLFSKNKKVVLGIAPYDYKLRNILFYLKNHQIYYHTSWSCWDGSFYPKKKRVTPELKSFWKDFIENKTQHIFAVSQKTKNELLKNYDLNENKISVVYHSLNDQFFNENKSQQNSGEKLKFVYAGRLRKEKGIEELLDFFAKNPEKELTLAGDGDLKSIVESFQQKHENIIFKGQINEPEKLAKLFGASHYLILNSKKSQKWEELFGMVLIEAMACGAIPIATNHTGPREIIRSGENGFLVEENEMIDFLANLNSENYNVEIQKNALKSASEFKSSAIGQRWKVILED